MTFDLKPLKARWLMLWTGTVVLCVGAVALVGMSLYAVLPPDDRELARRLIAMSADFGLLVVLVMCAGLGMASAWLTRTYFQPIVRAADQTRLIAASNMAARVEVQGPPEVRTLAQSVNALAAARQTLAEEDVARTQSARADADRERHRLAALMAELTQGVVVCNADGRIVLYNESARNLLATPVQGGAGHGYLGIGRSLFTLMDQQSIEHALANLRARIAEGVGEPMTTFMTTLASGALVRVRIAPVAGSDASGNTAQDGYVLLLADLSRELSEFEHREALLAELLEQSRAGLAGARAATENLATQPSMPPAMRTRFLAIAQDELTRLTRLVERADSDISMRMNRHPHLEPMRLADLMHAVAGELRQIPGVSVEVASAPPSVWVQVESFGLMQALRYLVKRLVQSREALAIALRASAANDHVYFDCVWSGDQIPAATVLEWETAPLDARKDGGERTLRGLIARNRGEFWHQADATRGEASFRILLRSAAVEPSARPVQRSRPVYYDFDLFHSRDPNRALDDQPLRALAYTAFDTETTGLEPSAGDEIIAIGAVRIVNGRLLRDESFDQLIDPKRPIDPEAIKIHGIRPDMVAGQPDIASVLPAFHRFCEDTVLLGHNAAFDMRFLEMKEAATGLRFSQPVLDTLLLSALLHEASTDHRLEAIARRIGVDVVARHTALGDAILTAEVFLRMLPLLEARGIATLKQAREASERTYYAKLRY